MHEFDAIVVLGHSTDIDNPVTRGRIDQGLELLEQKLAPRIIMSGCCSMKLDRRPRLTEAKVMRTYALARRADANAMLLEEESADTLGNAYYTKLRHLEPCGWLNVALVTTDIHSERAAWIFRKVLGPGFRIQSYAAESPPSWSADERARHIERNRQLLQATRALLSDVDDGDHDAVARHLGVAPA